MKSEDIATVSRPLRVSITSFIDWVDLLGHLGSPGRAGTIATSVHIRSQGSNMVHQSQIDGRESCPIGEVGFSKFWQW